MPEKLTKHGVRDLNHLGPKRPSYASDLVTRREQQLCEHRFEHVRLSDGERHDECKKCNVKVACKCGRS